MSENTRYSSEQNSERTHLDVSQSGNSHAAGNLDALDKAATQGEWLTDDDLDAVGDDASLYNSAFNFIAEHLDGENAAFIVAIVNAFRSGDLVPRVTSEEVREAWERYRTMPHHDWWDDKDDIAFVTLDRFIGGDE